MKKLIGTILIMILFAGGSFAGTISADKFKNDIQKLLVEDFSAKTSADIEVKVTMLPFNSMTLPDGVIGYKLVSNGSTEFNTASRQVKRVDVLVNGKLERTVNVPIELKVYEEVLIASDYISREQPITSGKVRIKKINIADKANAVVTKDMLKKDLVAKKDYREGEILDKRFVKLRPDVVKNADVRIILNSNNGFQISIDGVAKTEGTMGEYVTVENRLYKKIYSGKVVGENTVQVNI